MNNGQEQANSNDSSEATPSDSIQTQLPISFSTGNKSGVRLGKLFGVHKQSNTYSKDHKNVVKSREMKQNLESDVHTINMRSSTKGIKETNVKVKGHNRALEWLAIARVLDRFFLMFFFLASIGLAGTFVSYGFYRLYHIDKIHGDADSIPN